MPASIAHFVSLEMCSFYMLSWIRFFATSWHRALITMFRMEAVIHVAPEIVAAMEPWANADEDAPAEPLRTVITKRSTVIGGNVIIAVGTVRGYSDLDADLSLCSGRGCCQANSDDGNQE
jgi:hypothetical protein